MFDLNTILGLIVLAGLIYLAIKLDEWYKKQQQRKKEEEEEEERKRRKRKRT